MLKVLILLPLLIITFRRNHFHVSIFTDLFSRMNSDKLVVLLPPLIYYLFICVNPFKKYIVIQQVTLSAFSMLTLDENHICVVTYIDFVA